MCKVRMIDWLRLGLTTCRPLWVMCRLPDKGRKEIEETAEEIKERDREERGKWTEGTQEITTFPPPPLYPYQLQGQQTLPNCKPISVGPPGDKSYRTPSPHPFTPKVRMNLSAICDEQKEKKKKKREKDGKI